MKHKLYKIDSHYRLSYNQRKQLGLIKDGISSFSDRNHVRAVATGEFRPPKKGEWFLSGAIVEAHYAPNDLSTDYFIAKLVRVKVETKTTVTILETGLVLPEED